MSSLNKLVPLAELKRPHGLRGELRINFFNKDSRLLKSNQIVFLNYKQSSVSEYKIEYVKYSLKDNMIKFFEIETRDDASKLSGFYLNIFRDELPQLDGEEYYLFDLIDFGVLDDNQNKYGIVTNVLQFPANNVLVVFNEGKEHLVPIINDIILRIDHNGNKIIINPIPGLFDL